MQEQSIIDQWSIDVNSWSIFGDPNQVTSLETQIRKKVVDLRVPVLSAAAGLDLRHPTRKCAVFRGVRMLKNLHRFDGVDRQIQPEVPTGGICGIETVDQQCTLLFSRSLNIDFSGRRTHYAGDEWQRLIEARSSERKALERLPSQGGGRRSGSRLDVCCFVRRRRDSHAFRHVRDS